MQESVTLTADIGANTKNDEAGFTTKLARPLNLPGQWRVSIMDISYPNQWTTIHHDLTYAVMVPFLHSDIHFSQEFILDPVQPNPNRNNVITEKPERLSKNESMLFGELKDINFRNKSAQYEVLTDTICEGEHVDPTLIAQQIANKIISLIRRRFPQAPLEEYENVVSYNPVTRCVTFKNLRLTRYIVVAPADDSIISLLGHGDGTFKVPTGYQRVIDV